MKKTYTIEEIEEMLTLPCCHTSGEHDPCHYEESKYVCKSQVYEAFENLCRKLKINPKVKHDKACGWCRNYPKKKKGDGKEFWDKPHECVRCGNGTYMHDNDSYEGYCKDFLPTSFKTMLEVENES